MEVRKLTRLALLLAMMVTLQSLRMYVPLPFFVSVYIIGSLVNACLLLALESSGLRGALVLAGAAPVVAFFQQMLPLPLLVFPVAAANTAYLLGYRAFREKTVTAVWVATAAKFILLYLTIAAAASFLDLPKQFTAALSLLLGWPQWITGLGGGAIFLVMRKRMPIFAGA